MVIYIQSKLSVVGVSSLFESFSGDMPELIKLGVTAFWMLLISFLFLGTNSKPCMIEWLNLIEGSAFLIAGIVNNIILSD